MEHNLTFAEALDRFLLVEDTYGNRVSAIHLKDDLLKVYWDTNNGSFVHYFPGDKEVRLDGHYLYASDDENNEYCFRAYTIVNFDDELPPQSC